ncbi:MAG TPA: sulfur carrier protein ThiS [Acidimicrobiales bacterium]|nr:sulfur carrier protein ThiS [Acidimicrobiales bacterium]
MDGAVLVNGEERVLAPGATVEDVVRLVAPSTRGCAVAVNGEVVARSAWPTTLVRPGDRVEVVTAAPGG